MARRTMLFSAALLIGITALHTSCAHISGKTVARKDPPNILVAVDGSICVVSKDKFDKTEVGMKALCAWHGYHLPEPRFGVKRVPVKLR